MKKCYISLDYAQQTAEIYQKLGNKIERKMLCINKTQPLQQEISEFINLVKAKTFTTKYAQKATDALKLSLRIQKRIKK